MCVRTGLRALVAAAVLLPGLAGPGPAQEAGGVTLTFGLSERLQATRNLDLDAVSRGTTYRADTRLSVALSSVTRTQSLTFSANAAGRAADGPDISDTFEFFTDPNFSLGYRRQGAGSSFRLNASVRSDDVSFLRPLTDFITDDGVLDLPDDIDDLEGDGTRRSYSASTGIRFGEDGPTAIGLSAGANVVDYIDAGPELDDYRRTWIEVDTRLIPAPGRTATASLRYTRFEDEDPLNPDEDTLSFDSRVAFARPIGEVSAGFGAVHTETGTRFTVDGGWRRDLPAGNVALVLGATRTEGGNFALTGRASLNRELAVGNLNAQLRRTVTQDTDNDEEVRTGATVSFSRPLTPRAGISMSADYTRTTDTGTELSVSSAALRASVSYALTPDWNMNVGYNRRYRNEEGAGTGWVSSDTIFFGVSRQFGVRW